MFPRRLENENSQGKFREHEKLAKHMEFRDSVMEFYKFCLKFVLNLYFLGHH